MKYYKLTPEQKEAHNRLLVKVLRSALDLPLLTDIPGAVVTVAREGAIRAAMVNIYNIGDIAGIKEWWEKTWRAFGELTPDVKNMDFDHQFNVLIDETISKLYPIKNDEMRVIRALMEMEELRGFVAEVIVSSEWARTRKLFSDKMMEYYLTNELDERYVKKLVKPIEDAENRKEYSARINAIIGYFSTPMN